MLLERASVAAGQEGTVVAAAVAVVAQPWTRVLAAEAMMLMLQLHQ